MIRRSLVVLIAIGAPGLLHAQDDRISKELAEACGSVDAHVEALKQQLLDEVESLAISRPVDIKRGARFSDEVRQFEVTLIRTALGRTSGSQIRAAKLLGLKPTTLNAKIKRYNIAPTYQPQV